MENARRQGDKMIDNISRGVLVLGIVFVAWLIKPSYASNELQLTMINDTNKVEKEKK